MTSHSGKEQEGRSYIGKFVRRGDSFAIGPNNHLKAEKHIAIATKAGLAEGSEDAGTLEITLSGDSELLGTVKVSGDSDSMSLPRTTEARRRTGELLREIHPGFKVTVHDSKKDFR